MKLWDKVTGKKEEKKLEMPEKVEAVQITEESLKSEIETSVSDFKNEDKKVEQIEQSVNLEDRSDVEEVKNELQLDEKLSDLNKQADELKNETLEEKEIKNEVSLTSEQLKILGEILDAEQGLKIRFSKKEDLIKENSQFNMNPEDFNMRMNSIDIEILQAQGKIYKLENELKIDRNNTKSTEQRIKLASKQEQGKIPSESKEDKDFRDKLSSILDDLNSFNEFIKSSGHTAAEIGEFEYSGDPVKEKIFKDLEEKSENLNFSERFDELSENYPNQLLDSISEFKELYFKRAVLDNISTSEKAYYPKIVETFIKEIPRNVDEEKYQSLKESIELRLIREKQKALIDLPIDEVLKIWENDPKSYERYNSSIFEEKVSSLIENLIDQNNYEKIKDLVSSLDKIKELNPNLEDSSEFLPVWVKYLNKTDVLKTLTKTLPEEEFAYYFQNKFVPLSIVPDNLKEQFVGKTFKDGHLSVERVKDYCKFTNKTFQELEPHEKAKILDRVGCNNDGMVFGLQDFRDVLSTGEFLNPDSIPEEMLPELEGDLIETARKRLKNGHGIENEILQFPDIRERVLDSLIFAQEKMQNGNVYSDVEYEQIRKEKISKLKNIQESFKVSNGSEKLPPVISQLLEKFKDQYGRKGKTLVALAISAYGTENPENFKFKMEKIEEVLNKYDPDNIPDGAKVSMGIEYEATDSINYGYSETSILGYKKDILLISESANIGIGTGGIHEIATKPNYNPYMLMAEVKLMQDAGLLDLNFKRYDKAPRGYHLSLVGDSGLTVGDEMYFLHNVMTMGQLAGITAGKEVIRTQRIHSKLSDNFSDVKQGGERCEIKGMATDSVEQFEKAIITAHHAGIAIQLYNEQKDKELESDQAKDIVNEWEKLKQGIIKAVGEHNKNFIDSEFYGSFIDSDGEYIDNTDHIDVTRNQKLVDRDTLGSIQFKDEMYIRSTDLFFEQKPHFVNALTHINNIFLKGPQGDDNSPVNAGAVLNTMKKENYGGVMDGKPQESIFERGGEFRDGYYYVQGASEEMITHKTQILLNHFNKNMERLLQNKGVKRNVTQEELVNA